MQSETNQGALQVSVIMANYNGGPFIVDAMASVARQTMRDLELIVVDDGSTDDSVARVEQFAGRDPRVRLLRTGGRTGPAAARNTGLGTARGRWVAILDSDDIMHPGRLATLIDAGTAWEADIVADNQILFSDDRTIPSTTLLRGYRDFSSPVSAAAYIRSNAFFSGGMPLGYLKPLFRRSFLEQSGCRYDCSLRIAEDYDLVLRLLLAGAQFRVSPQLSYFYRRHGQSISHRLSSRTLLPMLDADRRLRATQPPASLTPEIVDALDLRRQTILRALDFETLVEALKQRQWADSVRLAARKPRVAALLAIPVRDRLRRALQRSTFRATRPAPGPQAVLLSRQRIVGATNGSSVYLLSICAALRQAGYEIDLISPSPAMFGRWPVLRLDPAMRIFSTIRIRGAMRIGPVVVARDPRIALRAAAGIADRLLRRLHLTIDGLDRKAPHAIAVPLTDADRLFIASVVRRPDLVLTDYAFLNEAIPFALRPCAPSAVVMHDFFSDQDSERAVVRLDRQAEAALLGQADAILAIQAEEADKIRSLLPDRPVILAPMAVTPVQTAQPGDDGSLLFVGSNTLPNLDAMEWFLEQVWPAVLAQFPDVRLRIAGTCCGPLSSGHPNVTLLGRVDDLDAAYRQAGIVISPLRLGSGLKIKLVEALGHGKAIIATETTLQGVGALVSGALIQADQPGDFVTGIAALLYDRDARMRLGQEGLAVAQRHFSADACYRGLIEFARDGDPVPGVRAPAPSRPAMLQNAEHGACQ